MIWLFAVAPVACSVTLVLTGLLGRLAPHRRPAGRPGSPGAHAWPTPCSGGIAVVFGTAVAAPWVLPVPPVTAVLAGALTLAVLGLMEDVSPLSPAVRLGVEAVTAVAVALNGVHVTVTGGWLDIVITAAWLVAITNSFNALDNADGALGLLGTVSATGLAMAAFLADQPVTGVLLIAVASAGLGFLWHNWAPARVLMGNAGSLFIGFLIAACALLLVAGRPAEHTLAGLLLPTLVATVDTAVVVLARGRRFLHPGAAHVSHRLRGVGLEPWAVAALPASLAGVTCALNLAVSTGAVDPHTAIVVAGGTALVLIVVLLWMNVEPRLPAPFPPAVRRP
ncbi:glycosyltransferase family 4 protein [Streptosporangium sp. NPDC000396]|uniref:glycosyltransferase family 4 protein n=1 Tax=Streptosporangium sp. NPDC000396 TaxID=3366185 RepID=UPI00369FBBB4